MIVKICGIKRMEDLVKAVEAGADMVGFIVGFPKSPRNITPAEAVALINKTPASVKPVVVCPADGQEIIDEILRGAGPYAFQLHGAGEPDVAGARVIRVVPATGGDAVKEALKHVGDADYILLDSSRGGYGGTGVTHDWRLSREVRDAIYPKPLILAGGLKPENVCTAVRVVKPYGVDVSTGVEERPGVKDADKIKSFIQAAKRCGLEL
ncbi:MAG TPA: phosphoribosylanthranilate isomerase [Candidatus Caldiarchaeum subterraneum]|uniref:N-(5'-phosphoribosyl)anthranilate isomerase n=1 Tax=Caldiarchaeum subterraneum TaxID=311458 RepID=A0A833A499_CALS0|nr:phosphoribosylanthranilate isomerase [Candidatus Caldarchaeum subterraneum]